MTEPFGLYLHIPFCSGKCAYCDFYSVFASKELQDRFVKALIREIKQWGGKTSRPIDTLYFGGGTPSLLADRLPEITAAVRDAFAVTEHPEITLEMNPGTDAQRVLDFAARAGINRLSIGAQSGIDRELRQLGRRHSVNDTVLAVEAARKAGFQNISLDLMIGLPDSDSESVEKSLVFAEQLHPEHISAYLLKLEQKTAFYRNRDTLNLPSDDAAADQYLAVCRFLEKKGYQHYEISSFSKPGFQSRHNLKYWQLKDYLGIGPAAHSFFETKRFFYERDLKAFLDGTEPIDSGSGGDDEEFIMLRLRTDEGLAFSQLSARGIPVTDKLQKKCTLLRQNGLLADQPDCIILTDKGMLLSNSIITEILECVL